MVQFSKVLLVIDKAHTVPQRAIDCSLRGLNQVYGHNCPTSSVKIICGKYINIFTRCTNRNQYDILMTAAVGVLKGQTAMSYKSELQTLTKQSMRHQVCTGETRHISESTITMLMSRGRCNCGATYYVIINY